MIENSSVGHLLTQVQQVVQSHENDLRVSGSWFSFIHALDIERDEVRLHTRFIGYLLNPKAGHFQGDKFLKLFFEAAGINEITDGFTVEIEKHIGKRDWDNVEGGRIDLLISNNRGIGFAIEVKIHAVEQKKQLQRYSNYLMTYFKNEKSKVYFLTLEGDESKFHSEFKDYNRVSFSKEVLNWIESSRLASEDQPSIRETLIQYIANIKRLTNQNPNDKMSEEIINLITESEDSFKAFVALNSVQHRLYSKFGEILIGTLSEQTDLNEKFDMRLSGGSIPNNNSAIKIFSKDGTYEFFIYWINRNQVGFGLRNPAGRVSQEIQNRISLILSKTENDMGNVLSMNGSFDSWFIFFEFDSLKGHPQISYDSWQKFKSPEVAHKVAEWISQISDAYQEVISQDS